MIALWLNSSAILNISYKSTLWIDPEAGRRHSALDCVEVWFAMVRSQNFDRLLIACINIALGLIIVVCLFGIPLTLISFKDEVATRDPEHPGFELLRSEKAEDYTEIELAFKDLNVVTSSMGIEVSGYHQCSKNCDDHSFRLHISSFTSKSDGLNAVPVTEMITIPKGNVEFSKIIRLPVLGTLSLFPFDKHHINISIAVERLDQNGSTFLISNSEHLHIIGSEELQRLHLTRNDIISDYTKINSVHTPTLAFTSYFERPFYVKFLAPITIILLIITSLATVLSAKMANLMTGSTGIIFGVWGARALVIGDLPPESTFADVVFMMIVLVSLMIVIFKLALFAKSYLENEILGLKQAED